jgi:hypothetical protein
MEIKITEEQGQVPVTVAEVNGRVNLGSAEELEQKIKTQGEHNLIRPSEPSVTSAGPGHPGNLQAL